MFPLKDDEWKLLNEELHEKRPHYLIHTCGMKDRKIQSPIEKDLKQIPAEDMVLAEQSIGSGKWFLI